MCTLIAMILVVWMVAMKFADHPEVMLCKRRAGSLAALSSLSTNKPGKSVTYVAQCPKKSLNALKVLQSMQFIACKNPWNGRMRAPAWAHQKNKIVIQYPLAWWARPWLLGSLTISVGCASCFRGQKSSDSRLMRSQRQVSKQRLDGDWCSSAFALMDYRSKTSWLGIRAHACSCAV